MCEDDRVGGGCEDDEVVGGFTLYLRMTGLVEGVGVRMTGVEVYLVLEDDGVGGFTLYLRMTGWVEGVRMTGWVEV